MSYRSIGVPKEAESPENPGGLDRRVALVPDDVSRLTAAGVAVAVETGAGEGVGFDDAAYLAAGAKLESKRRIYQGKDLIVKFKGPPHSSIDEMAPGSTLLCMAHVSSVPERLERCRRRNVTLVALEDIVESPERISDEALLASWAMSTAIGDRHISTADLDVHLIGFTQQLRGAVEMAANQRVRSLHVHPDVSTAPSPTEDCLVFHDSRVSSVEIPGAIDMAAMEAHGRTLLPALHAAKPPRAFGLRRVQALRETGMAGARYGLSLRRAHVGTSGAAEQFAVVLGYGNVAMGALEELIASGIGPVAVLGRRQTAPDEIAKWLSAADLVVNGAEPPRVPGVDQYLVTRAHVRDVLRDGTVLVDLIGGSPTNRSPIESVVSCTYLTDPYFIEDGVYVTALWGWPMMGMMRETAIKYSSQITEVLLGDEHLLGGIDLSLPGLARAVKHLAR